MSAMLLAAVTARAGELRCEVGAYRLDDGRVVDIAPSVGRTLRWRRFDGETGVLNRLPDGSWTSTRGWTGRPDGIRVKFGECPGGRILYDGIDGHRIPLEVAETRFVSHGTTLAGRLLLPAHARAVPIVVLLHGAERDSARASYALQRLLPAEGVGAFVYDKRGTGASGGEYTQDFQVLAADAVAAMGEARRLAGSRATRMGYQAGSQGGWVAPIAASRAPADFVIVCFGLAVSVIDEDREQMALELGLKGYGQEVIAKALEVATAAEQVFESGFTSGFEQLEAVQARYGKEPWFKDVHGNFSHFILGLSSDEIRAKGKSYRFGTPFRYDPMPILQKLAVPQLWVLGGKDLEAPSEETGRRIRALIAAGQPITLAIFPHAEHGMTEFELARGGERISTRYAPRYFDMIRDFALRGRIEGPYGSAIVTLPAHGPE